MSLTEMEQQMFNVMAEELEVLRDYREVTRDLLKLSLPYVVRHYESSANGFGKEARKLIYMIEKYLL